MPVELLTQYLSSGKGVSVERSTPLPIQPGGFDAAANASKTNPQPVASGNEQNVAIQASAAQTVTGNGTAVTGYGKYSVAWFELDVTLAATEAGDTLNVFVQTQIDGTNWVDIVHFTEVLGNGAAKRFVSKVSADLAETMFETGTALAAAGVRHILGDSYRARWAIVDVATTGNQSFTFSVKANFVA